MPTNDYSKVQAVLPGAKGKLLTASGHIFDCLIEETRHDFAYGVNEISFRGLVTGAPLKDGSCKEAALKVLGLKVKYEDLVRILFQAYFGCVDKGELRGILQGCEL